MGQFTVKPTRKVQLADKDKQSDQWTWGDGQLMLLLVTGSLLVMTGAVVAPVLPRIVQELQLDPAVAGYLVSAHYLTVAIFSPLLGILADRVGQVRVLIISLVLYAIFGAAGGVFSSFGPMLVTRALVGIASGGIAAASLGLLVKRYRSEASRAQAIAAVATVLTLANIAYPIIAGVVGGWHWRWVFALYSVGIPLAVWVAVVLRPSTVSDSLHASRSGTSPTPQLLNVIKKPGILGLYAAQCGTAAIAHATIIYLPLYLKATLDAGVTLNGIILASQALGAAAASAFVVRRLTQRLGLGRATVLGFGGMGLALVLMPQGQGLHLLFPVVISFGLGLGVVVPSLYTWVANLAPSGLQSSVLAMCVGANFLGQFLSPSLFGIVVVLGELTAAFYIAAGLSLLLGSSVMGSQAFRKL